jgi:hypothetical protein
MIQREIEKSQKQRIAIVRKAKNTKPTFGERFKPPTIG